MSGTTIGDGAVVGAGAVVTGVVRPYSVVTGVPARERRRRFNDEDVDTLLRVRWWEWSDAMIAARVEDLCNPDINGFLRKYARDSDADGHQI